MGAASMVAGVPVALIRVGAAHPGGELLGFAGDAFLTWRVWRGGSISFVLLLFLNILGAVVVLAAVVIAGGSVYLIGLLLFQIGGLLLLTSPAVHRRFGTTAFR